MAAAFQRRHHCPPPSVEPKDVVFDQLHKLAALRDAAVVTKDVNVKKAELLARL